MHTQRRARVNSAKSLAIASLLLVGLTVVQAAPPTKGSNTLPQISGSPPSLAEIGMPYAFQPTASDADRDTLRFKIQGRPGWASFDSTSGKLSGRPSVTDAGTYSNILISVSDGKRGNTWVALPAFSISVKAAVNSPPQLAGTPPTTAIVETTYDFVPAASDPDGDPITFSISNRPAWAGFNSATGGLRGTPARSDAGVYSNIVIQASDGTTTSTLPSFSVTVESAPNQSPVISGSPAGAVIAGQAYSFQPSASDPDGDALTYSIANKPAWATFSSSTGRLSGTPSTSLAGITFSGITISVSDGVASAALPAFSIAVETGNRPPVINGTAPTSVTAGQSYAFQPTGSDPDGDTLTFSITNKPVWATFSSSTGRLAGTPSSTQAGTYSGITISVSDGSQGASLAPFAITVQSTNRPPTISGSPTTSATAGQAYAFQPSASDPDGNTLTFSISNKPAWATFSSSTGRLSGTPAAGDVGTYSAITISVSDGTSSASLGAFSIAVMQSANGSVTLSWNPPTTNSDGSSLVDLAGFRVVYGQVSRQYTETIDIPTSGISSAVIENLLPATWYFAVKAYTRAGVESDLSNEASKTIM